MNKSLLKIFVIAALVAGVAWWFFRSPVIQVGDGPTPGNPVVILLHGHGTPADDLESLANKLLSLAPDACFLLPAGPYGAGLSGRTWQESVTAPSKEELQVAIEEMRRVSRKIVTDLIAEAREQGLEPENIYIGGFSLGAKVALDVMLSEDAAQDVGNLIYLSGTTRGLDLSKLAEAPSFRAFVSHGRSDKAVGFGQSSKLVENLQANNIPVTHFVFEGGHQTTNRMVIALGEFITGD